MLLNGDFSIPYIAHAAKRRPDKDVESRLNGNEVAQISKRSPNRRLCNVAINCCIDEGICELYGGWRRSRG